MNYPCIKGNNQLDLPVKNEIQEDFNPRVKVKKELKNNIFDVQNSTEEKVR